MDGSIHRLALRAAAQVAWLSLASGCGGATERNGDTAPANQSSPEAVNEESPEAVSEESPEAVSEESPEAISEESPEAASCSAQQGERLLLCCNELLDPYVPADGFLADTTGAVKDPEVVACCGKLASLLVPPTYDWGAVVNCCAVAGFPEGVCTPWGPPVPPEFTLGGSWA